jgi:hypothetical protein
MVYEGILHPSMVLALFGSGIASLSVAGKGGEVLRITRKDGYGRRQCSGSHAPVRPVRRRRFRANQA